MQMHSTFAQKHHNASFHIFLMFFNQIWLEYKCIRSKSDRIGGANLSARKYWRKKCVNCDNNILQQMGVNPENSINL